MAPDLMREAREIADIERLINETIDSYRKAVKAKGLDIGLDVVVRDGRVVLVSGLDGITLPHRQIQLVIL